MLSECNEKISVIKTKKSEKVKVKVKVKEDKMKIEKDVFHDPTYSHVSIH